MFLKIAKVPKGHSVFIIDNISQLKPLSFSKEETGFAEQQIKNDKGIILINRLDVQLFLIYANPEKENYLTKELLRKRGAALQSQLTALSIKEVVITNCGKEPMAAYHVAEGLALANYQFLKYKADARKLNILMKLLSTNKALPLKT